MIRRRKHRCPKMRRKPPDMRQKRHSGRTAVRDRRPGTGIIASFGVNDVSGIVVFRAQSGRRDHKTFDWKYTMSSLKLKLGVLAAGLLLSGCMETANYEATNTANFKPHDKELLAKVRYENVPIPEAYRRAIVEYHRKEAPGTIAVD